jgi:hypothetical protein
LPRGRTLLGAHDCGTLCQEEGNIAAIGRRQQNEGVLDSKVPERLKVGCGRPCRTSLAGDCPLTPALRWMSTMGQRWPGTRITPTDCPFFGTKWTCRGKLEMSALGRRQVRFKRLVLALRADQHNSGLPRTSSRRQNNAFADQVAADFL